jgi:hypothetical protein
MRQHLHPSSNLDLTLFPNKKPEVADSETAPRKFTDQALRETLIRGKIEP